MKNIGAASKLKLMAAGFAISLGACSTAYTAEVPQTQHVTSEDPFAVDPYGAKALASGDYPMVATRLEAMDDRDPFAQLNLANAYENMGRVADAKRIYQFVLSQNSNPYADLGPRKAPLRVKTIASRALNRIADNSGE